MAPAGDVNGSGFPGLLVGNQWASGSFVREGAVYVFYGSSKGFSSAPNVVLSNPFPEENARFGSAVAGIGDFNHDGFDDIAVGCPYGNGGQGCVAVYYGSASGISPTPSLILDGGLTLPAVGEPAFFGFSLSPVGDIKGNGQNFVIAGEETGSSFLYATQVKVAPPVAKFTGNPLSGDAPLRVKFTDESTGKIKVTPIPIKGTT